MGGKWALGVLAEGSWRRTRTLDGCFRVCGEQTSRWEGSPSQRRDGSGRGAEGRSGASKDEAEAR